MTNAKGQDSGASALDLFGQAANKASTDVIRTYSTSFALASRLLGARHRQHVYNIYAMVRIADEIVDGVAADAGLDTRAQSDALEAYIRETHRSMRTGYSNDLILHAFARTARECGIDESLTVPFFQSMRADAASADTFASYDAAHHAQYVYGSAEVIGLMCLQVFLRSEQPSALEREILTHGAKQLGAAFQNINFLRDLADDTARLHRGYLSSGPSRLTDDDRDAWIAVIRGQLAEAEKAVPLLPVDARAAVRSAHALFVALTSRIARTPAQQLYEQRVRVPDAVKIALAARAVATTSLERER